MNFLNIIYINFSFLDNLFYYQVELLLNRWYDFQI